jgi:hypothetical protein
MLVMKSVVENLAVKLLRAPAEQAFGSRVHECDPPAGIHHEQRLGRVLRDGAIDLLARYESVAASTQFQLRHGGARQRP